MSAICINPYWALYICGVRTSLYNYLLRVIMGSKMKLV